MPGASDLVDYPPSEVLNEHLYEIGFDDGTLGVILKTFSNYPLCECLLKFLQPMRFGKRPEIRQSWNRPNCSE